MLNYACLLIPAVLVAFIWEMLSAAPLLAKDVRISGDFEYTNSTAKETNKMTGETTENKHSRFSQLYGLDISRRIFPNLQFNGGGIFELEEAEGSGSEFEEKTSRPYLELLLNNPLYRAGVGYRRTDIDIEVGDNTTDRLLEEYTARLGWRPADFPQVDMNFTRTNIFTATGSSSREPDISDRVIDGFILKSRYDYKDLFFNYFYTHRDTRNELEDSESLTTSHDGSVQYARRLFDNRVTVDTGMRLFQTNIELSGTEVVKLPAAAAGSVFIHSDDLDHRDDTGQVEDFSPLGEGVAIDAAELSFRIDFGTSTELDTIYILLEGPRDPNIANRFQWRLFTNITNLETWEEQLNFSITYDSLENRFEIVLPRALRTESLKIVSTAPPGSFDSTILVVGLEALTTIESAQPGAGFEAFEQNYNLGVGWRITDRTSSRYDFYYQNRTSEPGDRERTLLTNSVNFSHTFNRVFSGSTRLLRSDSTDENEKETGYDYAASLQGNYLDTFRQTLTYSGSNLRTEEGSSTSNSVLLRNVADLYLDWSAILDFGYAWNEPLEGGESTSKLIRAGTHLQPHQKTDINLDYTVVWSSRVNGRDSRKDTGSFRFLFVPVRTVSLFAGLTYIAEDNEDSVLLQDYNIGWSPFPDGTLQFSFGYNTSLLRDGKEKSYTSLVRWRVARGIFLDLNSSLGTAETSTRKSDFNSYTAKLRVTF